MATTQLNCRVEALLAKRLREAAAARHTTTGALVAQAIEALLAGDSASPAPPPSALAALEARVALLEQGASPQRVSPPPPMGEPVIPPTGEALTTAELAEQTGTNRAAWNNWAKPERIGQVRRHPQAGGWRLVGKAAPPNGGPERWLWQAA